MEDLNCEISHCDFLSPESLEGGALAGVEVLYHVAAVFKHWAQDEEKKEIVEPNIIGTRNILQAAHKAGVKKNSICKFHCFIRVRE